MLLQSVYFPYIMINEFNSWFEIDDSLERYCSFNNALRISIRSRSEVYSTVSRTVPVLLAKGNVTLV